MGKPPTDKQQSRREEETSTAPYGKRMAALQRPDIRKKVSEGVRRWRQSQTAEERKAHNAKIAASYRRTVGKRLLENPSLKYGMRAPIKLWMEGKIKTLEETR